MRFNFSSLCLCAVFLFGVGCTAKAKLQRYVKRADAYYAKGQFESARIEYLNAFRLQQNNPHVAARLGESFLETGDVQRGFQLLSHARELQPTNNAVRLKIASLLLMSGDAKRAREEAETILKNSPLEGEALVLLANSAATTNEVASTRQRLESLLSSAPRNASIHLALGILSQRTGNPSAAEAHFDKAVECDPKSPKANLALGNLCFARGNTNKADLHFKAANDLASPKSVERLAYAEFLVKTARPAEGKTVLEAATAKAPDFVAGWNMLTQIALAERNTNSAARYIQKALARDQNNRDALLHRSRLKLATRDFGGAIADLQQLAERFARDSQIHHQLAIAQLANDESAKALATLDKAINLNTNNLDAVLLRAQIQISRGDLNSAIPELLRITRQAPRVPQPHYLLAGAYRQRRSLDEAVSVYTNIARIFPNDPQPFQQIGTIRRQQNNFVAARQSYEAALKINPDFLPAIDDLIELDVLAKRHKEALARVQTYIEKYPDKPMPRLLQAKVFFAENRNEEAEASVKKAIELDPEFYPAHRALADFYIRSKQTDSALQKLESMVAKNAKDVASLLQVGMLHESKTNFTKARAAYEALLKVNPDSAPALNNLAYILSERVGDSNAALQHARHARDLAPYDPYTADTFGWILYRRGDYQGALAAIQQAADRLPNQPEVLYHLGMTQYMLGAVEPAISALTAAANAPDTFPGKDSAQKALEVLRVDPSKPATDSLELLSKAVQANPNDAFAWTRLAQLHESQGNFEKARENYEQALRINPRSALLLARLAVLNAGPFKNPTKALELAKQAWGIAQTAEIAAMIGPVGVAAGDFRWSQAVLMEAQRSPTPESSYALGIAAYAFGRLPQAIEAFEAAASAPLPRTASLAKAGATLVRFLGGGATAAEAETAVKSALAMDPQFPPAVIASGLLAEEKGDFPAARVKYEEVLNAFPGFLLAQRQLVILLGNRLADDAKAAELAAALRTEFVGDPELSAALGKIAYRRGDYNDANRLLRTATSNAGYDPELLYYYGMAQYHLKDKAAKATLNRAITEKPGAALAADARKALAELK